MAEGPTDPASLLSSICSYSILPSPEMLLPTCPHTLYAPAPVGANPTSTRGPGLGCSVGGGGMPPSQHCWLSNHCEHALHHITLHPRHEQQLLYRHSAPLRLCALRLLAQTLPQFFFNMHLLTLLTRKSTD